MKEYLKKLTEQQKLLKKELAVLRQSVEDLGAHNMKIVAELEAVLPPEHNLRIALRTLVFALHYSQLESVRLQEEIYNLTEKWVKLQACWWTRFTGGKVPISGLAQLAEELYSSQEENQRLANRLIVIKTYVQNL